MMKPEKRFQVLKKYESMFSVFISWSLKDHEGNCYDQYACKHNNHSRFGKSKHVLVCEEHKEDKQNNDLFEKYKMKFITKSKVEYKDITKNMTLSFYADTYPSRSNEESEESSIFMQQTIVIEGKEMIVDVLTFVVGRANNEFPGPNHNWSLHDGKDVNVSGVCFNKVTTEFPKYNLHEVQKDIIKEYEAKRINWKDLPKLPKFVGGYCRYHAWHNLLEILSIISI